MYYIYIDMTDNMLYLIIHFTLYVFALFIYIYYMLYITHFQPNYTLDRLFVSYILYDIIIHHIPMYKHHNKYLYIHKYIYITTVIYLHLLLRYNLLSYIISYNYNITFSLLL